MSKNVRLELPLSFSAGTVAMRGRWVYILRRDLALKRKSLVKLGRMKPADAGLRAVTDLWMGTHQKVIESGGFTSQALRRIDPNPRLAILIEYGVLTGEQQAVTALRTSFERAAAAATE